MQSTTGSRGYRFNQTERMQRFEAFLNPNLNRLYGLALSLAKDPHDAEDLLQLTCMKAWRAFDTFVPGDFKKWITTILFNTFINMSRRKRREPFFVEVERVAGSLAGDETTDDEVFLNYDYDLVFGDEVSAALEDLPDKYRVVVLLCDVVGMRYKEIADIVKAPIGTIMSRLHRGRRILAGNLVNYAASEYGYAQ